MKTSDEITNALAKWSLKYPRSRIYGFTSKFDMDKELIAIEKDAVEYMQKNNKINSPDLSVCCCMDEEDTCPHCEANRNK